MNKFSFVVVGLLILVIGSCTQQPSGYKIEGFIEAPKGEEQVIFYNHKYDTVAIAQVKDGKFLIKGSVNEPTMGTISYGRVSRDIILENASYIFTYDESGALVKGGNIHETIFGYQWDSNYLTLQGDLNRARSQAFEGIDKQDRKAMEAAYNSFSKESRAVSQYIHNHYKNILEGKYPTIAKMFALERHYDWVNYGFEQKIALLDEYEKELGQHKFLVHQRNMYKRGLEKQEIRDSVNEGKPFKDFESTTINGERIKLSEVVSQNKYTLVEFWASWCGPCRGAFPHLKELYEKYHDKGLEVFGVSLDNKEKDYRKASEEEKLPWVNTVNYEGFKSKPAQDYAVSGIPYTVLIGNDGTIVGANANIRGYALEKLLEKLFAEEK